MDEFIRQLTHDNDTFQEQWPMILTRLEELSIFNNAKSVLNALADYVLTESIESSPCEVKYVFVTLIINQLIKMEDTDDLADVFIQVLDASRMDQWHLHFLRLIYQKCKLGERLTSIPLKINLIEQILRSLRNKIFISKSEDIYDQWEHFLNECIFSKSMNNDNILNTPTIITNMQTEFQQFYKHAVQQSQQSSIWLKIASILNESSSELCSIDTNFSIEMISSDYVQQLIESYENNPDLLYANYTRLLTIIEHLILTDKYDEARSLLSKLITPNLTSINPEILLRKLIQLSSVVKQRDLFCSEILSSLIYDLANLQVKKNLSFIFFDLILATLKLYTSKAPNLAYILLQRKDFYTWKELINDIIDLIKTCISYETIVNNDYFSDLNNLEDITNSIGEQAQVYPMILSSLHPIVLEAIFHWSNSDVSWSAHVYRMGMSLLNLIDLQQINEDICLKFIDIIQNRVNSTQEEIKKKNRLFFQSVSTRLSDIIVQLKRLSHNVHLKLATLFDSLLEYQPFYDEDHNMTFEYVVLAILLFKTSSTLINENDARLYQVCLNRMYNTAKNENETSLYQWWTGFWLITGTKLPNVAMDHIEQFIDYTFHYKDMSLVGLFIILYIQRPELFHTYFDNLLNTLLSDNGQYLTALNPLFSLIIRQHPEIVLPKHLDQLFSSIETFPFNYDLYVLMQTLGMVANYHPYLFDNHQEKLIGLVVKTQNLFVLECFRKYVLASVLDGEEKNVNEYLDLLVNLMKNNICSEEIQKEILQTCLLIGLKYKQILIDRRQDFVALNSSLLLNYIDNAVLNKIDQTIIKRAFDEILQIELSIDKTKKKEKQITSDLPSWSDEIAQLLNRSGTNDWRLLGKELGFSSNEIKHWATQSNPCIALLSEWFMTHKVDEAISCLRKALRKIDRYDVEQIILSNLPIDMKYSSPVYLTFHSSTQSLVTKLSDHLRDAGYACHMYNEQTESCNICEAKVVVYCLNRLFIQSENCLKIFHLIVNMKKPFIILNIEDQALVLSDDIGKSILNDYLYIQLKDDKKDDDQWPEDKFIELLGQIRYHVAPNYDMLSQQYRYWFVSHLDTLIFLKSFNEYSKNDLVSLNGIPLIIVHPQIIISYQWDARKDVLYLYKQLTQSGYRVWLDIFQMDGAETLAEKFHMAIRQAFCLLVCITPKYMKSIICRHEISLANDLNKPVIPLLFEETDTFDLVLSTLTGKPWIDFRHASRSNRWTGKSSDMLLTRLHRIVPHIHSDKPRHLLEMQRPISASRYDNNIDQVPKRISSAPLIPKSQACSLM